QLEAAAGRSAEKLMPRLRGLAKSVDLDEPQRGGGVILVAFFVGRELMPIQAVVALAADDLRVPLVELDSHGARDVLLVRDCERHQVLVELAKPEAIVDQVGVGLTDLGLEPERLLRERQKL